MPSRIPQAFIQDLLARVELITIIGDRVSLVKRGANYLARCPFHEEKTPSFSVNAHKQFYYCFGCGAHGNAIGFLMAFDKMTFLEALSHLAARLGLEIPRTATATPAIPVVQRKQTLYATLEAVARYYQRSLRQSPEAIAYLKSRGLDGHTAQRFGLGFAGHQWDALVRYSEQNPARLADLVDQGLVLQKGGRYFDRFRQRILFPIRDIRGRVIAFGGRTLGDELPKYLNSPETSLFHKGSELYGLYEAHQVNRSLPRIILVEGYMDVIALHQHGITDAVATLGTAITLRHLQKVLRYTNEVIFCWDGDAAGQRAAWKALTISLPVLRDGICIRFMFLPPQEDPDSWIRKIGKTAFEAQIQTAEALSTVFFRQLQERIPQRSLDDKARLAKEAYSYLNTMPQGLFRELLSQELTALLHVTAEDLEHLLQASPPASTSQMVQRKKQGILPLALQVVAFLLHQPELIHQVPATMDLSGIDSEGGTLLSWLWNALQNTPHRSVGSLMAMCDQDGDQQQLAQLAARKLLVPAEGVLLEFQDALMRLTAQKDDSVKEQLYQKIETGSSTLADKQKLGQLLRRDEAG